MFPLGLKKHNMGSHPRVLFKTLILLVNNYTQLYAHIRHCPNNTLNPTLINPNQIRALKRTLVL